jgi:hypothetical protein
MPAAQLAPKPYQNVDFDSYTQKISKIYNKYSSSSGSKEYDNAGYADEEIQAVISAIEAKVPHVSFSGKQDAINAIIEITLEVAESDGSTLESEVRKSYYWGAIDDTINRIIDGFSPEEITILQEDGNMAKELEQLKWSVDEWVSRGDDLFVKAIEKVTGAPEEEDEEDEEESDHDGAQDALRD